MRNINVRIPTDYQDIIKKYPEINCSEIVEKPRTDPALKKKVTELDCLKN